MDEKGKEIKRERGRSRGAESSRHGEVKEESEGESRKRRNSIARGNGEQREYSQEGKETLWRESSEERRKSYPEIATKPTYYPAEDPYRAIRADLRAGVQGPPRRIKYTQSSTEGVLDPEGSIFKTRVNLRTKGRGPLGGTGTLTDKLEREGGITFYYPGGSQYVDKSILNESLSFSVSEAEVTQGGGSEKDRGGSSEEAPSNPEEREELLEEEQEKEEESAKKIGG
eukprot:GHVU01146767.1.p1 GENE.GHVU01146767.1~~GHVU01146767.1.p1  ORF type:complete len:227 (+),score=39.78 GHVU01146767.1:821-1501(+)